MREHESQEHPAVAVRLLSQLKADESEYVRKSAGNALRDISRKHKDLVRAELQTWNVKQKAVAQTYQLAGQFVMPKTSATTARKEASKISLNLTQENSHDKPSDRPH